jgi:hypothetical protein
MMASRPRLVFYDNKFFLCVRVSFVYRSVSAKMGLFSRAFYFTHLFTYILFGTSVIFYQSFFTEG